MNSYRNFTNAIFLSYIFITKFHKFFQIFTLFLVLLLIYNHTDFIMGLNSIKCVILTLKLSIILLPLTQIIVFQFLIANHQFNNNPAFYFYINTENKQASPLKPALSGFMYFLAFIYSLYLPSELSMNSYLQ